MHSFSFISSPGLISESMYEGTQPGVFGFHGCGLLSLKLNCSVTQRDA